MPDQQTLGVVGVNLGKKHIASLDRLFEHLFGRNVAVMEGIAGH